MPQRLPPLPRENEALGTQLKERDAQIQALQTQLRDRERNVHQMEMELRRLQEEAHNNNREQETLLAKNKEIARLEASVREKDQALLSHVMQHESELQRLQGEIRVQKSLSDEAQLERDLARAQEEKQQMLALQQAERDGQRDNEVHRLRQENERLKRNQHAPAAASRTAPALANQVVIDNHIILAGVTDPATYSSPAVRRTRSNPGVGHEQSPSDCPSKNSELRLIPELKSTNDWRGSLSVPRTSKVYGLARTIIERAAEMMDNLDMTQDLADNLWNTNGQALLQLLDTDNNQTAVQRFELIAGACESVLRSQPVLLEVVSPSVHLQQSL